VEKNVREGEMIDSDFQEFSDPSGGSVRGIVQAESSGSHGCPRVSGGRREKKGRAAKGMLVKEREDRLSCRTR